MAKVTGLGGVFIRARDPNALGDWYRSHLGVPFENGFAAFMWRDDADLDAQSIWAPFEQDSEYFGSATQQTMINLRVDDLDALLSQLAAAGVDIVPERSDDENGRIGWITDPEGNRIELWEPKRRTS
jgi:predicted enzyme related to lactoylglutathione lyase